MGALGTLGDWYHLEEVIGEGALAIVYRAYDLRRHAYVAIKMLKDELVHNHAIIRSFQAEATVLSRLQHPHIVRIYSFENTGSSAFLVLDYIPGKTLRQIITEKNGPLPVEQVSKIFQQIGGALSYAHEQGVLHRDIKPENVIIRSDDTAFLTDFGIARLAHMSDSAGPRAGTPAYMAPEQVAGKPLDFRSDMYSLGVMLFELLAGRRPFLGDEPGLSGQDPSERIRQAHLYIAPPDPRRFNPNLSEDIAVFLLRTLAKNPQDRWPDLKTMLETWVRLMQRRAQSNQPALLTTPSARPFGLTSESPKTPAPAGTPAHPLPSPIPAGNVSPATFYVAQGPKAGTTIPLSQPDLLVGRGEQCQIRIPDPHLSRIHCRLRFAQGWWFIQDQNSLNGVYINGHRVQAARLNPGDQIQIGQSILVFQTLPSGPKR